jgi:glycosyltransferase involved in cell wall biosynthesis
MSDGPPPAAPNRLALFGGFLRPRRHAAHGTQQAAYLMCQALAEVGGYDEIHVYQDPPRQLPPDAELVLPRTPPAVRFDKPQLAVSPHVYAAIYAANGEQITASPWVLRPQGSRAPVVCSIGTTHITGQWLYLLVALASGASRTSDGFIFKSQAARSLFESVWQDWRQRLAPGAAFPGQHTVIGNGVDVQQNRRSPALREDTRRQLRIGPDEVVFLAFSRLSPGTKGDPLAQLVRWRQVLDRAPRALLILSGMVVDRTFVAELRATARAAGVAERVLILDNPYELMPDARERLMSAADAFLHLTTGIEEASSLVVHEAMAHGLPVIASRWAGLGEVITEGETGFLIETASLPVAPAVRAAPFGAPHAGLVVNAGQLVTCDWAAFVERAVALATGAELRARMAAAARARMEGQTLQMVARRYAEFFQHCAREASGEHVEPARFRPLVDLEAVLRFQGARGLPSTQRLRAGNLAAADLVGSRLPAAEARRLREVLASLAEGGVLTAGELAVRLQATAEPGPADSRGGAALADQGLLMARLLNYGVVEPDGG